jgi:hypothetical protein
MSAFVLLACFMYDLNKTWIFSADLKQTILPPVSNVKKILPVPTEVYFTERQTNTVKVIVAFRSFANTPNTARVANVFLYFEVWWVIYIRAKLNKCDT